MKSKRSIVGTIILLAWAVVSVWPIWYFATIALRPRVEIIAPDPIYWPTFTTETWAKIWDEWPMMKYFFNSLGAVAGSVVICLLLGIPAAYAFEAVEPRGVEASAIVGTISSPGSLLRRRGEDAASSPDRR